MYSQIMVLIREGKNEEATDILEALRLLDESKKIEKEKGQFHLLAAWCHEYLKNFEEAERCYDMGMKAQPKKLIIDIMRASLIPMRS